MAREASRTVTSQVELDKAIADGVELISINSPAGVWLTISDLKSSRAELRGSSSAELWESSSAVLRESSSAVLWGSSSAELWESSSAVLWGSSSAELWESSSAVLRESSSAHAHNKSRVKSAPLCAVFLHDVTVDVLGGVILDHSKVGDMDGAAWCEYHGVSVSRDIATLYKAVNDKWTTGRGTDYSPGSKPKCADWRYDGKCGGGLHFGPTPRHAKAYHSSATKFVAVGVRVSELCPIHDPSSTAKAKAPRVVRPCVEVDIDGNPVEASA